MQNFRPVIGVSRCLIGAPVRYDGNHRKYDWITQSLAPHVRLVDICPEVAIGLGVPRPPIELRIINAQVRAVRIDDHAVDVTAKLREYGVEMFSQTPKLSGFIFKARSPSCGVFDTRLVQEDGSITQQSRGVFADALFACDPLLPMIDEQQLDNASRRLQFLAQVYLYSHWYELMSEELTAHGISQFIREFGLYQGYEGVELSAEIEFDRAQTRDNAAQYVLRMLMPQYQSASPQELHAKFGPWLQQFQ